LLTLDQVYHAAYVLKDVIRETELISAPQVNPESEIYLKTEISKLRGHLK
jgi:threonine dehydratase